MRFPICTLEVDGAATSWPSRRRIRRASIVTSEIARVHAEYHTRRYNPQPRMALTAGTKLGPYEIQSPLGTGGMGEVYRARDTRLERTVAVKILPAAFSAEADRLQRFEQEARVLSALNHPNLLSIYDVGSQDGIHYLVSEFLEGQTLRERMEGGVLPQRKVAEYALQLANGLAAAHDKMIVHRDLKPENVFVTRDERVKILDFGLAKLAATGAATSDLATLASPTPTVAGTVMGTAGYMSPEQVRGQEVDHRSDVFSFGATLYEMISGKRAFKGDSSVETMNAILKEDPFEQAGITLHVPPELERIIRRCLEKTPERRFQSASDLGFALEALSVPTSSSIAVSARIRRRWVPALVAVAVLALFAVSYDHGRRAGKESPPLFHPLTFRRGTIRKARFAPDGETIVFGAAWDGNPSEVFTTRPDSVEARSLGLKGAEILAVSSKGEMAVSLGNRLTTLLVSAGTLARVPLAGGEPREVLESVQWADWNPDGSDFAIVRNVRGRSRLEYPTDRVLHQTGGWISDPRFSRDGRSIAFVDHSTPEDQSGSVTLVDLAGNKRILSGGWTGTVRGLAWSPDGKEVWFTATKVGGSGDLYAVTPSGHQRLVARVPGGMALQDIDRTGRVLFTHDNWRREVIARAPGEVRERDFSWLDWSYPSDFSDTRKMLLISEEGSAGGPNSAVYLRRLNEPAAIRLGDGVALSISPDGKWVLSSRADLGQLALLPVKAGDVKWLPPDGLTHVSAAWFSEGNRFLFSGNAPGQGGRIYVQGVSGANPSAITPEGVRGDFSLSPDNKTVAAVGPGETMYLYPVSGGKAPPVRGFLAGEVPVNWSADGRSLYIYRFGEMPARVYRLELATGQRTLWKELMPPDRAGLEMVGPILIAPTGESYVYSYRRLLSELYLAEGLR